METFKGTKYISPVRLIIKSYNQKSSKQTDQIHVSENGQEVLYFTELPCFFKPSVTEIIFTSIPLHSNKLGSGPNFANPEGAARAWRRGGEPSPGKVSEPVAAGKGALCCSSGPAGPRAGIGSTGLATGREAVWRTHDPLSFLTHLSPETYARGFEGSPTPPRTRFYRRLGKRPRCSAFSELVALPTPNSPRLDSCLSEPAFPIGILPHVIWIPSGELADILIHVLKALFGLF